MSTSSLTFEFPVRSDSWPVGFGFRPTEEELITHYLPKKMLGNDSLAQYIREVDLNNYDPQELPGLSNFESGNHEWFFFRAESALYHYNNTNTKTKTTTNRTTSTGSWKPTGNDKQIMARGTDKIIGYRKILVFHRGENRTNWKIHEYRLHLQHTHLPSPYQRSFVVCRLKHDADQVSTFDNDEQNHSVTSRVKRKVRRTGIQEVSSETRAANGPSVFASEPANFKPQSAGGYDGQFTQPEAPTLTDMLKYVYFEDDDVTSKNNYGASNEEEVEEMIHELWDGGISSVTDNHAAFNLQVHSETQPAIGASVFEPDTDSSYSEPQLYSRNVQSVNAYSKGEMKELERSLLSPCTLPESSFCSDVLTRRFNELENLVNHQSLEGYHQPCEVYPQSRDESIAVIFQGRRGYHQPCEVYPQSLEEYHQSRDESCEVYFQSRTGETKTFKASKSKDLESYARRILLFIVKAIKILLFIVRAISQYTVKGWIKMLTFFFFLEIPRERLPKPTNVKEDEQRKKVVCSTSQISITDSSNGQKSEGGNKYGCMDSTTKHIQQEQDTTNVPSVDVVIAFLAIIMLVLSVCILLQLLWERVLKMMQGRRARYLFVALLSCAAVWWKSG